MHKKIVILGSGFAGVNTYLSLVSSLKSYKKSKSESEYPEITLINKTNHFLFTPLLHEVATGSLSEHQVVESLHGIMYKTGGNFLEAEVQSVDLENKIVKTTKGDMSYDILVVALGSQTNFFGIEGAEEHTLPLKTLQDALVLKNTFISIFEQASGLASAEERKQLLSFSVIGGGPTGVESAAEMADLFFETFNRYYKGKINCDEVTLNLLTRDKELLPMFESGLRESALKTLKDKKVKIYLNAVVKKIEPGKIYLEDGIEIQSRVTLYAAGVTPVSVEIIPTPDKDRVGRILVNKYLNLPNMDNVFVLGDIACTERFTGKSLPMLAQVAVQQGKVTGRNIAAMLTGKNLSTFVYKSKGSLVSLGQWHAVGKVAGILWTGPVAWFIWRTAYLFNFNSWPNRIRIAVDWTLNLFNPRDITKA
jgi:NADH dehydrogenase